MFKKWNLKVEDPIDIDQIYGDIFDGFVEFTDIYNNAKDVSEITEDERELLNKLYNHQW